MLRDKASDEEMVAYFKSVETKRMGLGSEEQFDRRRDSVLGVIAALRNLGTLP